MLIERIFANLKKIIKFRFLAIILAFACSNKDQEKLQYLLRGNEYLENADYDNAISAYEKALMLDPDFVDAFNNKGVAYYEQGNYGLALESYNQAIQRNPDYYSALLNRSNAYIGLGRTTSAIKDLEAFKTAFPDTAIVYFSLGLAKTKAKNYVEALAEFRIAGRIDPNNLEVPLNIGTIHYYLKNYDSAEYYVDQVLQKDPGVGNAYNALALMASDKGELISAMEMIEKALDFAPDDPYFLNNRGFIYLQMDSLDLALSDINESIRVDPYNGWAYRNKGIYHLRNEQFSDAVRLLEQAVKMDPSIDKSYFYLGNAYHATGDLTNACRTWKESLKRDGDLAAEKGAEFCESFL